LQLFVHSDLIVMFNQVRKIDNAMTRHKLHHQLSTIFRIGMIGAKFLEQHEITSTG